MANNITTRGIKFYNALGFGKSMIQVNVWNDSFLSLAIAPYKENTADNETKFDYDNMIFTALSPGKVFELLEDVSRIREAYKSGKNASAFVDVSGNNIVGFGTTQVDEKQVYYLAIHKDLNEGKIPKVSAFYEFNDTFHITDYDPETGEHGTTGTSGGEFSLFVNSLKEYINTLSKATAHSVRVALDYDIRRIESKLDYIGRATGAKFGSGKTPTKSIFNYSNSEIKQPEIDPDDVPF